MVNASIVIILCKLINENTVAKIFLLLKFIEIEFKNL